MGGWTGSGWLQLPRLLWQQRRRTILGVVALLFSATLAPEAKAIPPDLAGVLWDCYYVDHVVATGLQSPDECIGPLQAFIKVKYSFDWTLWLWGFPEMGGYEGQVLDVWLSGSNPVGFPCLSSATCLWQVPYGFTYVFFYRACRLLRDGRYLCGSSQSPQGPTWGRAETYGVPGCPVEPLEPYSPDPYPLDIANLTQRTKDAVGCLATCSGQNHTAFLSSAYRPVTYQDHLREVWSKWNDELKFNETPACAALKAKVKKEFDDHGLGVSTISPSRGGGCHSITAGQPIGSCFDVNSWFIPMVDSCSTQCNVYRPWPYLPPPRRSDPIHVLPY